MPIHNPEEAGGDVGDIADPLKPKKRRKSLSASRLRREKRRESRGKGNDVDEHGGVVQSTHTSKINSSDSSSTRESRLHALESSPERPRKRPRDEQKDDLGAQDVIRRDGQSKSINAGNASRKSAAMKYSNTKNQRNAEADIQCTNRSSVQPHRNEESTKPDQTKGKNIEQVERGSVKSKQDIPNTITKDNCKSIKRARTVIFE